MPRGIDKEDIARMNRLVRYVRKTGSMDGFDPEALDDLRVVAPGLGLVVLPNHKEA